MAGVCDFRETRIVMNQGSIEFTKPTSAAYARMKSILFAPFEADKWFVLGFTAWLATLMEGGGSSGGQTSYNESGTDEMDETFETVSNWIGENLELVIGLGALILVIVIAVSLVLFWVSSRGKFMFLDNVIHNRALVKQPWAEFREEGNSLFLFFVIFLGIVTTVVLGLAGGLVALLYGTMNGDDVNWTVTVVGFCAGIGGLLFLVIVVASYVGTLLEDFVIPLMHRDRQKVGAAWRQVMALHCERTLSFVLYFLWKILIGLGVGILIVAFVFATCCIGGILIAIPYLGAVVLLPVYVFMRALGPEFLSQFGPGYDLWPGPDQLETAGYPE